MIFISKKEKDIQLQRNKIKEKLLVCLHSADPYYNADWLDNIKINEESKKGKNQIIEQSKMKIQNVRENVKSMSIQPMSAIDEVSNIYSIMYTSVVDILEEKVQAEHNDISDFYCFAYLVRFIDVYYKSESYKHISENENMHEQIKNSGRISNIQKALTNRKYAAVCHELAAIVNAYDIFDENIYKLICDVFEEHLNGFDF